MRAASYLAWRLQVVGYWLRPYDVHRDARCWRWRRIACRPLLLADDGTWQEGRWGR